MNRIIPYLVSIIIVACALVPPIDFELSAPLTWWPWFVLLAGFAGMYLLFLDVPAVLKIISFFGFLNCFFSAAIYLSFTAYISLISCCYFFLLCRKIKNHDIVFRFLQTLLVFNAFLMVMQFLGKDTLLNAGRQVECFGAVGQHMQMGSFSVILGACILLFNPFLAFLFPYVTSLVCYSAGTFLSASVGLVVLASFWNKRMMVKMAIFVLLIFFCFVFISKKFVENTDPQNGRLTIWEYSLNLASQRPLTGWGIGTYKFIFPAMSGVVSQPWKESHNCWIQLYFETGVAGLLLFIGYFISLFIRLRSLIKRAIFRDKAVLCIGGLAMLSTDMLFAFPTRMLQCVPLIIFFLSYCEEVISYGRE